jgi:capsular polysaccharide biosynthesis protein
MENAVYNEFNMRELISFLRRKLWLIVLLAFVGGLGGYLWAKTMVTPVYVADSQIYVYEKKADAEMSYTGLQIATQLRRDCEILITGKAVTTEVVERLGLRMSAKALSSMVTVKSAENTCVLNISCRDTDPNRAALILNTLCEVASKQLEDVMEIDVVRVLYEAEVPKAPSTQGARYYATAGGLGGLVVAVILLIVFFLVDDTIHNEEDVERYLGLPTLAAIPASKELGEGNQRALGKKILGGLPSGKKR